MAGTDRGLPGPAAGHRCHTGRHAARGQHAAVPAPVLSQRTGCDVYLKVEGANPTGSFKDRGMTMAVSKAVEAGNKAIICASTGNTSASAAAYAARAGLTCAVLVPQGKIALGKLAQALVHGARLLQVQRQLRRLPRAGREARPGLPGGVGQLGEHPPAARAEDRGLRDRRGARRRAGHPLPPGRKRRQHQRLLAGLPGGPGGRQRHPDPEDVRLPGGRRGADRDRPGRPRAVHHRHRHPDRQSGQLDQGARRPRLVRRPDRRGDRPGDPIRVPAAGPPGRGLRGAGQRRERRRACCSRRRRGRCRPGPRWSVRSPGTGSRTRNGRSPRLRCPPRSQTT